MKNMVERIAARIEEAKDKAIAAGKTEAAATAAGQAKYRAYFVKTKLYLRYQNAVDAILITDDYDDCIVTVA